MHPDLFNVWVTAELSDVRVAGGHCYAELIEKDAAGQTIARMRANIWRSTFAAILPRFQAVTGRPLASGMKVLVQGSPVHHPLYGLSLNITAIDPSYTLGDLERLRREILMTLQAEGVLGYNRSLTPPVAPQRIAIISAQGAAGYGDFINQLEANPYGFQFYPVLFQASMQGPQTSPSVIRALDCIEMCIDLFDCVVIIRGGGSTSDLNGFDDLPLARRVATFALPVIVGIGHERDRTVLDEIACIRCKTPTAAAAWLIDTLHSTWMRTCELASQAVTTAADIITGERRRLDNAAAAIPAYATMHLDRADARLRHITQSIPLAVGRQTAAAHARLNAFPQLIAQSSQTTILRNHDRLDRLTADTADAARRAADRAADRLQALADKIELLSPQNTLRRGYSLTLHEGRVVRDPSALPQGATITTRLADATILSTFNRLKTED